MKTLRSRIPRKALKLLVLAAVLTAVALLTQEPAAVAGAFAATLAALYYRRPARRCLGR